MSLDEELDQIVESIPKVDPHKNYFLIRTEGGSYYEDFLKNNFIAIDPGNLSLDAYQKIEKATAGNYDQFIRQIKQFLKEKSFGTTEPDTSQKRSIGLKANQIYKFRNFSIGDIVIIPSTSSQYVSIGEIVENNIAQIGDAEIHDIECPYELRRRVKWHRTLPRYRLDVNLFLLFTSHQTIVDATKYANEIERSINDFYIFRDKAHIILNVNTELGISARSLFKFGNMLMDLLDEYAEYAGVDVSSEYLELQINLNSPGALDIKAKIKKTTLVLGLLIGVMGGGYEDKQGHKLKTDGLPGLFKSATESVTAFLNSKQDREMQQKIFDKYSDSLQVKTPDDLNKIMKQFSPNKDTPK